MGILSWGNRMSAFKHNQTLAGNECLADRPC